MEEKSRTRRWQCYIMSYTGWCFDRLHEKGSPSETRGNLHPEGRRHETPGERGIRDGAWMMSLSYKVGSLWVRGSQGAAGACSLI